MSKIIEAKCPKCGLLNAYVVGDGNWSGLDVMYCDHEDNAGCDTPFAIKWNFVAKTETYRLVKGEKNGTP